MCSHMRLTYQIRLLTYMANQQGARLVLLLEQATLGADLQSFVTKHSTMIKIRRP